MPFSVAPARTALLNIDLQTFFVEHTPDGLSVVERVNAIAAECRRAGILVIHTSHVLKADGSDAGVLAELMPEVVIEGILAEGSPTAALHPALRVEPTDILLGKPRFGAFHGSGLEEILRSRGIDTIVITGISTDVCCDTTAREANARDFRVIVLGDATATNPGGATPDEAALIQRMTLRQIDGMFGEVISGEELSRRIEAARRDASPTTT